MHRHTVLALFTMFILVAACRGTGPARTAAAAPQAAAARTSAAPVATADPSAFTGTVAETMNSGGYTYARLQATGKDDVWIAASEFSTKPGDRLTAALNTPMENFESKTLKRTFPLVYFVSDVSRDGTAVTTAAGGAGAVPALMTSHGSASVTTRVEPVAPPAGGMSIADVWSKRKSLGGREVTVRGTVVKVNRQIMGHNWIHLQDGSGSAEARTNDLTVTTDDLANVGDVITVKGVLAVDQDFGAGYSYGALLENGKLIK